MFSPVWVAPACRATYAEVIPKSPPGTQSSHSTSFTFTGLACGTTTLYNVDAFYSAGNRSELGAAFVQTAACNDAQPPTTPTNLAVTARTSTTIALAWAAWAQASPHTLRSVLLALKRRRDQRAAGRIETDALYEWRPGRHPTLYAARAH